MSFSSSPRPSKRRKTVPSQIEANTSQRPESRTTGKLRSLRHASKAYTLSDAPSDERITSHNPPDDVDCIIVQRGSSPTAVELDTHAAQDQWQSRHRFSGRQKRLQKATSGSEKDLGKTKRHTSTDNVLNPSNQETWAARTARGRRARAHVEVEGAAISDVQELVNNQQSSPRLPSEDLDLPLHGDSKTHNGRSIGLNRSSRRGPTELSGKSRLKNTKKSLTGDAEAIAVGLDDGTIDDSPHHNEQLSMIKDVVLEKLAGQRVIPLVGLDKETEKVRQLLEQSVVAGESNSMLLMGSRGAGKTTLVNQILVDLTEEYPGDFYVVRLNGLVQTDDKIALREIWRQLGREMDVEEESKGRAYADTLSTLLAILSHTPEQQETGLQQAAKSIVFIMDEFDLFAGHSRQTLLYNLFDIAQSRKAPIAVLGLTTRMDIVESLEKRVKSRFSHRYVILNLPSTYSQFEDICSSALRIQPDEIDVQGGSVKFTKRLSERGKHPPGRLSFDDQAVQVWNGFVERLLKAEATSRALSRIFHSTKSLPAAFSTLVLPVALAACTDVWSDRTHVTANAALLAPDSKLVMLQSLPSLALALLIAAARLEISLDSDACNFNMAYDEYSNLAAKARVSASTWTGSAASRARVWSRKAAKSAWERLVELEIVLPVGGGSGHGSGDMVRCDVALEEIARSVPDMEKQLEQWCREL